MYEKALEKKCDLKSNFPRFFTFPYINKCVLEY
jgi:hypothetical protein